MFVFSIRNILNEKTVQDFHLAQTILIIVTGNIQIGCKENLDDIFGILWSNGLINSHVLCRNEIKFWLFYTFMPYREDCFTLSPIELTAFSPSNFSSNMTLSMDDLYPQKLKNFNKCPLYVAPSVIHPFLMSTNSTDGTTKYRGVDIAIITQISRKLNFSIEFKKSSDRTNHGVVLRNGTITGNIRLVCI